MDTTLPLIDLRDPPAESARRIGEACRAQGFFYLVGHGCDEARAQRLEALSHRFFALPEDVKQRWAMAQGGRAWRGWFPLGGELTSGRPDWKEGLYLGTELPDDDPRVLAGLPLHGRNLLPGDDVLPGFRDTVLETIDEVSALGHRVMALIARSLELPEDYFHTRYTADPLVLFRIFLYPSRPAPAQLDVRDGVGEHTDYGLLTLLRQDDVGGLQVRTPSGWIEAPPRSGAFVCNIGDMLDRMTGGLYHSTPHRVRLNVSGRDRLSFPLFFDPNMAARIEPIRSAATDDPTTRWDGASVHAFDGTYGDYVLAKVGKVFPQLKQAVLERPR
ncbi:isopenicillin N synthase family oxygenase [Aquincola sp. S2]|uniref:2-oxoglutarate-dependent ethylene/succinate-forming enzyme n=1 Tax=Pseudaquabacterium terrae TaxID=2732868 RepID=A0ABX2E9G0_9BURK|nr:isopenicillin N synthase family oxygenase [Aquabacterium terrae]NRF65616.1 isopenicillin N synthase family oxygenase [Aquabacterium terrae]